MHVPRYPRKPHASGQARIVLAGKTYYLGKHGTEESRTRYREVISAYLKGARPPAKTARGVLTVGELARRYYRHAQRYYGPRSGSLPRVKRCMRSLRAFGRNLPAEEFRPKKFRKWILRLVKKGLSRRYINHLIVVAKQAFDYATAEEWMPGHALRSVRGLREGQYGAVELPPVGPVDLETVKRTLRACHAVLRDLILFQRLTGARPMEAVGVKRWLLNFDGRLPNGRTFPGLWVYDAPRKVRKYPRLILLGPKAQAVLKRHLVSGAPADFLFSPDKALRQLAAKAGRPYTPRQWRPVRDRYDTMSYGNAVHYACERAGVGHWQPNQLRHLRATEIRSLFDADHARTVLGHRLPGVTGVYAEEDLEKAARVMRRIG